MMSRPVAIVLLATGCVTAAAGGAYVAVRQNTGAALAAEPAPVAAEAPAVTATLPVTETEAIIEPSKDTEAVVDPSKEEPVPAPLVEPSPRREPKPAVTPRRAAPKVLAAEVKPEVRDRGPAPVPTAVEPAPATDAPVAPPASAPPASAPPAAVSMTPPVAADPEPRAEARPEPTIEEITIPTAAVIGLEVETPITSEKAQVEDRIDARVTRDVYVDGKLAIPAGVRMLGSVTEVERGGKVKERARLGVRFHTLVLGDGRRISVRTDTIFREGQSPSGESSRKIGGAAVGGAVLGAILGGRKGAMIGGAAGAAGGTAAVMAGDRNAATIATGTVLNARVAAPVTIDVERR